MNLFRRSFCLLVVFSVGAAAQVEDPAAGAEAESPGVPEFSPLQGCWQTTGSDLVIEEQWMSPLDGVMLGVSRTSRDGRVLGYEFLRLVDSGDHAGLTAWPSGQEETTFRLTRYAEGEWVFENPEHDFPKRVVYRVTDDETHAGIHATTEAEDPEEEGRRIDFRYVRVACPG